MAEPHTRYDEDTWCRWLGVGSVVRRRVNPSHSLNRAGGTYSLSAGGFAYPFLPCCHQLLRSPMPVGTLETSLSLPGDISSSQRTCWVFLPIISPNPSPKPAKSLGRALSAWRQPGALFKADPCDAVGVMESSGGFSSDLCAHRR